MSKFPDCTLLTSLECTICYAICTPKIHQCSNGHLVCNDCLARIANDFGSAGEIFIKCPVCRVKVTCSRSLVAENLLTVLNPRVPCSSCPRTFPASQLSRHLNTCQTNRIRCFMENCHFPLINQEHLESHFRTGHGFARYHGRAFVVDWNFGPCIIHMDYNAKFYVIQRIEPDACYTWVWQSGNESRKYIWIWKIKSKVTKESFVSARRVLLLSRKSEFAAKLDMAPNCLKLAKNKCENSVNTFEIEYAGRL